MPWVSSSGRLSTSATNMSPTGFFKAFRITDSKFASGIDTVWADTENEINNKNRGESDRRDFIHFDLSKQLENVKSSGLFTVNWLESIEPENLQDSRQ